MSQFLYNFITIWNVISFLENKVYFKHTKVDIFYHHAVLTYKTAFIEVCEACHIYPLWLDFVGATTLQSGKT